jgi:putative nuclease YbcO-like protein
MTAQRTEALRSRKYLDGARGEVCKLRFVGICVGGTETTVACHVHDQSFGMGRKAHDISTIDGCHACHMFLDHGWVGKISRTVLLEHIIRGLQETLLNRVERGIVFVPIDLPERRDKPAKPRKPPAERAKVAAGRPLQSRNQWPDGRKLQQRAKP